MPKCLTYFVSDGYRKWSAHDVELALWSFHFAKMLQPELLESVETESSSCSSEPTDHEPKRRKRANKECDMNGETCTDEENDQVSSSQTTKKRKQ